MFNKNLLKGKPISYKKLKYATFLNGLNTDIDEYILPINYSVKTYNYNISNGALQTGLGVKTMQLPIDKNCSSYKTIEFKNCEVKASWVYRFTISTNTTSRDDFLVFLTTEGKLVAMPVYGSSTTLIECSNVVFTDIPTVLNYRLNGQYVLLISSVNGLYFWDVANSNNATKVENAPQINSICLHNERAFATVGGNREQVWFSKELDPTNWNPTLEEGGFITFADDKGQCNKVVSFLDRVYIFRDYGINSISAYANQTEFLVNDLFVSSGQIKANTVCVCGDRIIMLTDNGLYCFDGSNTSKLNLYINNLLSKSNNQHAIATFFNGKYYLACNIDFGDGKNVGDEGDYNQQNNNALIELDIASNTINILRGVNITGLNVISDDIYSKLGVCLLHNGEYRFGELSMCGEVFSNPTSKLWMSPLSDFGYPEKNKILNDIFITSKHPLTITIRTEKISKKVTLSPKNNLIYYSPKVVGKQIAIDFESFGSLAYISNPKIIVGLQ